MKRLEHELEQQCVRYARSRGWDCWKNENNGCRGIPDHSSLKSGVFFMVEFKRSATAHIRPEQKLWQQRHPDIVFFCHSEEMFRNLLESMDAKNAIVQ
ncbi:MAG: SID1 transmembrane family member [Bacteroidales bacterium]|nr:SID1 transmembrane family member [Bacteroidales bacterium]